MLKVYLYKSGTNVLLDNTIMMRVDRWRCAVLNLRSTGAIGSDSCQTRIDQYTSNIFTHVRMLISRRS